MAGGAPTPRGSAASGSAGSRGRPRPNGCLWSVTLFGNYFYDKFRKSPFKAFIFWESFYLPINVFVPNILSPCGRCEYL